MLKKITLIVLILFSSTVIASTPLFKDGLKLYLKGEIDNAVQIWQQLANEGDIQAQKQLGQYYLTDNQHRDYQKAVDWYRRASDQGDPDSGKHLSNALQTYNAWQELSNEIGSDAAYATMAFREHLHEGDDTHCGFVVEVKSNVVLIQTDSQARWFRKGDIYQPEIKNCSIGA
jgi:TPR repeat protein